MNWKWLGWLRVRSGKVSWMGWALENRRVEGELTAGIGVPLRLVDAWPFSGLVGKRKINVQCFLQSNVLKYFAI